MLKALYDYAVAHDLSLPDGYVRKTVAAYIMFSSASEAYVGLWMGDDREVACPDIGSLANSKEKSNVIIEKRMVVIPAESSEKSKFYRAALAQLGESDPDAKLCVKRLENDSVVLRIIELLDENKIKAAQRISFMVDGRKLHDSPYLLSWWQQWRQEILPKKKGDLAPCLITGEPIMPIATAPSIKGLRVVGGHSSGDALICFDKPAFCSYGQKQGANAPVSESAMGAVKMALDHLLTDAPILCGMKFVHWFDRNVEPACDPLFDDNLFGFDEEDENDETTEFAVSMDDEVQARRKADRMIKTVQSGQSAVPLDTNYHILLLSGVNGRVMVRRYERGQYQQLQKSLEDWNRDLALVNPYGTGPCKPMKLTGRLIRLLKYQKNDRKIYERLGKELSGVTPAILTAILSGGRLPDAVAIRSLAYIRSKLLSSEEEQTGDNLDGWACQWLKAWLIRKDKRSEEHLKETYNPDHPEAAYHCGAAMAVYAAVQNTAMPNVNTTIVQRFYASCIQTPALVLGRLSQLSNHHLEKIESRYLRRHYRDLLAETYSAIGSGIPVTLDLEKQSYFALGYYQMTARLTHERIEAANQNKAQEEQ